MKTTTKTTKLFRGTYLVTGTNVEMEISNDNGYWEIEVMKGEELIDYEYMTYSTKKEAAYSVQCYDWSTLK